MDNYLEFVKLLDDTRENIRLIYDSKQYIKSISALNSFLNLLEQSDDNDIEVRYNKWFVYKRLSAIYCKFKKHEDSMCYAKKAMEYQEGDLQYHLTIWLMALIQEYTKKKRAIKLYDKCIKYFSETKQNNYLMSVVRNKNSLIAQSNNNIKLMFWIEDINTFNNTTNIIKYIHDNAFNFALELIDKLVDITSYKVAFAT